MIRILPQQFYEDPNMQKVLVDGLSCIIHKKLDATTLGKEGYVSTHAITMVLQGLLRVENMEGMFDEIPAGKMVMLPKGLHTVSDILPVSGHFEAIMFFFEPVLLQQFLDSIHYKGDKVKFTGYRVLESNADIRFFAESLLRLYGDKTQALRDLTNIKLSEFLHLLHLAAPGPTGFAATVAAFNQKERKSLREFMQANYFKPLAIEDYAYLTGRSISTFTRDFKNRFDGIAPKQWLIERRLEKAYRLLEENSVAQVSEAAWESGYVNIPHFIKAFHKKYGITPKQLMIENRLNAPV